MQWKSSETGRIGKTGTCKGLNKMTRRKGISKTCKTRKPPMFFKTRKIRKTGRQENNKGKYDNEYI
jgi:hypothetical protein